MTETFQPRTLAELQSAVAAGARPKFLHFWGHQPQADGSIGKGCFSQWFPAPFEVDGESYATAEHFMMAEKAHLFGDVAVRERVLAAGSPAQAKKLGRLVKGFDDALWERERFAIVVRANEAKFAQNPAMRDYLLGTGERVLVEASPVDRIWGTGLAADDPAADDPSRWRGLNLLGFALMEVRARLRAA